MVDVKDELARQHMRRAVGDTALIQTALSRYWDELIDPSDFDASFLRFREVAVPLIGAGRVKGQAVADEYYRALMALEGFPTESMTLLPTDPRRVKASLSAAAQQGYTGHLLARKGADQAAILAKAKAATLRSAKRQVLNAGRDRLIERRKRDPNVAGWARVSDGDPCGFCAMLVSRGPVYDEGTVAFHAHDGCGCNARLVTRTELRDGGGWSADAQHYRKLWEDGGFIVGTNARGKLTSVRLDPLALGVPAKALKVPEDVLEGAARLSAAERLEQTVTRTNPGYRIGPDYKNNCHQVVSAAELRARGYDVVARPTVASLGRYDEEIARDWRDADGNVREFTYLDPDGRGRIASAVNAMAEEWPEGARGFVLGSWSKGGGGHVYNVVKRDGKLVPVEAQIMREDGVELAGNYFSEMKRSTIGVLRVDDLVPHRNVLDAVDLDGPARLLELEAIEALGKDLKDSPVLYRQELTRTVQAAEQRVARAQALKAELAESMEAYRQLETPTLEEARAQARAISLTAALSKSIVRMQNVAHDAQAHLRELDP